MITAVRVALAYLSDLAVILRPTRFQWLAVLMCAGALLFTDQGADVVLLMVEEGRYLMAPIVAGLFGIVAWYSARLASVVRMTGEDAILRDYRRRYGPDLPSGKAEALADRRVTVIKFARAAMPRIIGIAPLAILYYAVLYQAYDHFRAPEGSGAALPLRAEFQISIAAVAFVLLSFFVFRRRIARWISQWLEARGRAGLADACDLPSAKADVKETVQQLLPVTKWIVGIVLVLFAAAAIAAAADPVAFGAAAGVYVSFFLVLGVLSVFGAALAVLTRRRNEPVFTAVVLALALMTWWFDGGQYEMRTLPDTAEAVAARPGVEQAARAWLDQNVDPESEEVVPVYVVATAGGGSRAAYWTAAVLDRLQQLDPEFDRRLFAISGVSGGSVGAVAHLAAGARAPDDATPPARAMLERDFLAAPVLGLFLRDLPARLIAFSGVHHEDRGVLLERAWEAADRAAGGAGRWTGPFLSLWDDRQRPWPALFLNGTEVHSGRRIVTSNLAIGAGFTGATDLLATTGLDLPASTAANTSARFPIVGPAAHISGPDGERQIVDGGYFENFGAVTAREVLTVFWNTASRRAAEDGGLDVRRIQPVVIQISSDPTLAAQPERACGARHPADGADSLSLQLTAPIATMANTRAAHGLLARCALKNAVTAIHAPPRPGRAQGGAQPGAQDDAQPDAQPGAQGVAQDDLPGARGRFMHLRMCRAGADDIDPPLGWVLSEEARARIAGYLDDAACNGATLARFPAPKTEGAQAANADPLSPAN